MSTTQLFVEHLIAGALTLFGIVLIIFAIGGIDANLMEKLLKYEGLLTVVGVSAMYPLGIFTDNFADFLLKKLYENENTNFEVSNFQLFVCNNKSYYFLFG